MARLLDVLGKFLEEKSMSKGAFADEVKKRNYEEPGLPVEGVLRGDIDVCVGIVWVAQEILELTNEQANELEYAGREDAREKMRQVA